MLPRSALEAPPPIRASLVTDVTAHLFFVEAHRCNGISPCPKTLAREIPFFPLSSDNRNRALALQKSDLYSDGRFGRNQDAQMHVIRHQVSFDDLTFFLLRQFGQNWPQLFTHLPIQHRAAICGDKDYVVFALPLRVGQALIIVLVHKGSLSGWLIKPPKGNLPDSRNAQTSSGRTGRTSGLPFVITVSQVFSSTR